MSEVVQADDARLRFTSAEVQGHLAADPGHVATTPAAGAHLVCGSSEFEHVCVSRNALHCRAPYPGLRGAARQERISVFERGAVAYADVASRVTPRRRASGPRATWRSQASARPVRRSPRAAAAAARGRAHRAR